MSPENKDHYESEKEAIHLILTGIGDEIYLIVDACKTAHKMWEAIRKATNNSHKSYAPTSKASLPTRSHETTRHNGKEIAKPIIPPSESASDEDSDPEQAQKDKEMQKNLALIAKYFKKLYKPTNNNLRTSSNTRKNMDTTPSSLGYSVSTIRNLFTLLTNAGSQKGLKTPHTDEDIDEQELEAHYSYMAKIQEVPNADSGTDSEPLEQNDQNAVECDNEGVTLANLITNLKLDVDENKKIQKQLKKANASLTQELKECKSTLAETSRTLGESNSIRDSCLVALQNKQTEFERYKAFNDRTIDYDKLEHKLNETLGLLAQKDIDIKECLKLKAYEISVVQEKQDELVKQSLLTKSHYECLVKEKTKVITDLKLKEEKDSDKMNSMENQLKFLNKIVYKRSQSIQTIHMLTPKCPTFNRRPTFANPMYLKKAQNEKPCLYEIPHDQSDPANRLIPDREEILTLEEESRSKLNKDLVKPYDYTKELVDQAWVKHSKDHFRAPTAQDMEILIKTCLMCLALKTHNDSFAFVHELKKEMHADLKYVESFENEIDKLESDKAEFSNMYDMLLQECVSNDVILQTKASNVFQKEREQYFEIQDLKAQLQDKNIAICELKKLIDKCKGKYMETKFDKPSVIRQPNAQRIPKPLVLGKLAPFSDSPVRKIFPKKKSVLKTNESEGLSKPVTSQNLPQTATQAVRNTNVIKPGMYQIDSSTTKTRAQQLPKTYRNTNPRVSTSTRVAHKTNIVQLILFIVDSGCTKHMTGNLSLLCNFVEKYLGTVRFGNDQFAPILGYGDLVQGNITINRVYYVEGLNHNLFSVGQFCDADLEVAFRKSTCFVRDLQGNDLLTGNRGSDLYTISLQETTSSTPICLMAKASPTQAWLWHRRLSHLNFDYINLLSKKDVMIIVLTTNTPYPSRKIRRIFACTH
ncbi:retrovirus-related pol polyprotein from transposon TNT 1-94 [Tanacetum coccineum]